MNANVSQKIIDGAKVVMAYFEEYGPAPKSLSGVVAQALGKSVSPRDFADMIHYCRRVLGPQAGKTVVWNSATKQYGFPEDIQAAERYILVFNQKYMASRAETMAAVCGGALAQHGESFELSIAKFTHENYASQIRAMTDAYISGLKVERAAQRTGADAEIELEERVR